MGGLRIWSLAELALPVEKHSLPCAGTSIQLGIYPWMSTLSGGRRGWGKHGVQQLLISGIQYVRAAHGGDGGTAARLHAPENVAAFAGKSGARRRADK
jgi:hypothetical protein